MICGMRKCSYCGKEFLATTGNRKYCSKECQTKAQIERQMAAYWKKKEKKEPAAKKCAFCGGEFISKNERRVYCCEECTKKAQKKKSLQHKVCARCGKEFEAHSALTKYCSDECRRAAIAECKRNRGRKEEAKENGVAALNRLAREAVEHHMSYCAGCPIGRSTPRPGRMTNAEYIRSLDDKGLAALFNAAFDDVDVLKEQCNLCRYSDPDGCLEAARGKARNISAECDKATWRWLHDEARALADAV